MGTMTRRFALGTSNIVEEGIEIGCPSAQAFPHDESLRGFFLEYDSLGKKELGVYGCLISEEEAKRLWKQAYEENKDSDRAKILHHPMDGMTFLEEHLEVARRLGWDLEK